MKMKYNHHINSFYTMPGERPSLHKLTRHFTPKKSMYWVWVPGVDPNPNPNPNPNRKSKSIHNSILFTFWYRNQQTFKIFNAHKFLGLKDVRKIKANIQKIFRPKHFWCQKF